MFTRSQTQPDLLARFERAPRHSIHAETAFDVGTNQEFRALAESRANECDGGSLSEPPRKLGGQ